VTDPAGRITVLSDASFCDRTRAAGWAAAVIAPDGKTHVTSGLIAEKCGCANSAEGKAMVHALRWALEHGYLKTGSSALLATDSDHLVVRLNGTHTPRKRRKLLRRGIAMPPPGPDRHNGSPPAIIANLAAQHGIIIEVCKIDGHATPSKRRSSLRARVMARIDQMARTRMKDQRAYLVTVQWAKP
jgi:ribonuclease HI